MARLAAVILSLAASAIASALPAVSGTEATTLGPSCTLVGAANPDYISMRQSERASSASAAAVTEGAKVKARMDSGPEYVTITIINSHGSPISTTHWHHSTAPAAVSGNVGPGTIASGATAEFAVPTNWIGTVALADAEYTMDDNVSLIEGNYVYDSTYGYAIADFDISYVNGFTMATTCYCSGTAISGCNKNLWLYHTCDDDDTAAGACVNPTRLSYASSPTAFFAPCAGAAFTYTTDYAADASWGVCQGGHVTCCVGPSCTANPKQPTSNA